MNNASLVLAFEPSKGGKVLLFVGDATAQDLLGRTALYKVGHHGSYNATLKGKTLISGPTLTAGWGTRIRT